MNLGEIWKRIQKETQKITRKRKKEEQKKSKIEEGGVWWERKGKKRHKFILMGQLVIR